MSDVQRIRCRVESDVHTDRALVQTGGKGGRIGRVVHETAVAELFEETFGGHPSMLPRQQVRHASYCCPIAPLPGSGNELFEGDETLRSLTLQSEQCARLGSPMYASLFRELAEDYRWGGRTYAILAGRSAKPIHDAIPLRLAGAIHRVVLRGDDPRLARHYPSMGGRPGDDFPADFIAYMREHIDDIENGLSSQVQTNEVGRSIVPLTVSHWLTTLGVGSFDHLEIGASAGLNLNFDRYYAGVQSLRMGDPSSRLRFNGEWFQGAPEVPRTAATVARRRGVDIHPVNLGDPEQRLRLLSFVWPDQHKRMDRLRTAIDIATDHPPVVDSAGADTWLATQLARPRERATVVFHSIVWQYLGTEVQRNVRRSLEEAGTAARDTAPLVWVRMEPAGPVADVRATTWDGSHRREWLLAEIGYHGQDMSWIGREIGD